jgi:methylmalonyl-CoA mutase cobalamin-binding domain/chain
MGKGRIRVFLGKPGLDGHDRGVLVVGQALRDAGMEVIYSGLIQTPEMIVEGAIQEDADVMGLSILSGAHMGLVSRIIELLRENDAQDIPVIVGGIIPPADMPRLEAMGVAGVFGPGTDTQDIVEFIRNLVTSRG